MEKIKVVAIVVLLFSLMGVILTFAFRERGLILHTQSYYARVQIGPIYGIDVNNTALIFGTIPLGGVARRNIEVTNPYDFPVTVEIVPEGEISKALVYRSVLLDPKKSERILLEVHVPEDAVVDEVYEGKVWIYIRKQN